MHRLGKALKRQSYMSLAVGAVIDESRGDNVTHTALITRLKLTVASNTLWLLFNIKEIPDSGEISCQRLVTANGKEALFLPRNGPLIQWHCQLN